MINLQFDKRHKQVEFKVPSGKLRTQIDKIAPLRASSQARLVVAMLKNGSAIDTLVEVGEKEQAVFDVVRKSLQSGDISVDDAIAMIGGTSGELTPEQYYKTLQAIVDDAKLNDDEKKQIAESWDDEFWQSQSYPDVKRAVDSFRRDIA